MEQWMVGWYEYMYVCFYRGGFVLVRGFCPGFMSGVFARGGLSVSPSSFPVQFVQVSFVFIINFYFATAYGLFNYGCGGSHLGVLLHFLFLRSTPFYIYVLNGIQLNLQAFWQQEVRLTPITVEELEFIHRAPMRPYVPPYTSRILTRLAARQAIAACMQ